MPYNTTAIPPRKEVTGQTQLPLARVKKIIGVDQDVVTCSNNAAFVITLATELFIQHLATEAQNVAKLDRKPRRNIQYKDIANTVLHHDNLEFLEDVVPRTAPYKQVKNQAAATRAKLKGKKTDEPAAGGLPNGKRQKSLTNGSESRRRSSTAASRTAADEDRDTQPEPESRRPRRDDDGDITMAE